MNKQVICALRLYDDFSGRMLKGEDFKFWFGQFLASPIKKPDGYFVFTGQKAKSLELLIEAPDYLPYKQVIEAELFDKGIPVADCRLIPNAVYEKRINKKVTGKIELPGAEVLLIPQTEKAVLKYGGQAEGSPSCIIINTLLPLPIINLNFIVDAEDCFPEVFHIKQKVGGNQFELNHMLNNTYKPNAEIIRTYRSISRQDGSFTILTDDFYETSKYWLIYRKDKMVKKEIIDKGGG